MSNDYVHLLQARTLILVIKINTYTINSKSFYPKILIITARNRNMARRENIFVEWLKEKSKVKGLEIPKNTVQIFSHNQASISKYLQVLAKIIIEIGERDGELGIQALLLRLQGANRSNQQDIPIIHSAIDTVVSGLGYVNRDELLKFFEVPNVDRNTKYDPINDKTFDDKIEEVYSNVLNTIQKVRPGIQVTLPRLAELSKAPKKFVEDIILTILDRKPVLGEYLQFEQVFIRSEDTEEIIDELITNPIQRFSHLHCSKCQEIIKDRTSNKCPSCGEGISRCIVCKLPIGSDDAIGQCSECEGIAHLSHLQEWVKTQGKCPRCQQTTDIIIVREAEQVIEEALAYDINLAGIQIINLGEWKDIPEGSEMTDVQGFFNMLHATNEKKLNQWRKGKEPHFIGFFEQGRFFYHKLNKFDSIKEYLIALSYGFKTPEQLMLHRRALKHGWVNVNIASTVWQAIIGKDYVGIPIDFMYNGGESRFQYQNRIKNQPFIVEKYQDIFSSVLRRGMRYELLPPFDSEVVFGEDWFVWFYAYHNDWKSFDELNKFAKEVFPEFTTKYEKWINDAKAEMKGIPIDNHYRYDFKLSKDWNRKRKTANQKSNDIIHYMKERNDRFLKLVYLAVNGPFKKGDDWLFGWPTYDHLIDWWSETKNLNYFLENRNENILEIKSGIEELIRYKTYPTVYPYDEEIETTKDWLIFMAKDRNWSEISIKIMEEHL